MRRAAELRQAAITRSEGLDHGCSSTSYEGAGPRSGATVAYGPEDTGAEERVRDQVRECPMVAGGPRILDQIEGGSGTPSYQGTFHRALVASGRYYAEPDSQGCPAGDSPKIPVSPGYAMEIIRVNVAVFCEACAAAKKSDARNNGQNSTKHGCLSLLLGIAGRLAILRVEP